MLQHLLHNFGPRILRVGERLHHFAMLVIERDRRAFTTCAANRTINRAFGTRCLRDCVGLVRGQQEGRVRGEHSMQEWRFPMRLECIEVVLIGQGVRQCRLVRLRRNRREVSLQPRGTCLKAGALQFFNQRLEC